MLGASQAGATPSNRLPPASEDGETPNVSPEEQANYDAFMKNALEVIYPKGEQAAVAPAILAHLKGEFEPEVQQMFEQAEPPLGGGPTDNLAATTVALVVTLDASAKQAGKDVGDDVVLHAGADVLSELAEVAEAANIHDFSDEEIQASLTRAMDLYRGAGDRYNPEQAQAEFGQVVQADKDGTLDQLVPGIGQAMKKEA